MKPSVYRITLDVHDSHSGVCLDMKQRDTARQISINLTDGGFPYQIGEECFAVFAATKPDGKKLLHHCSVHGNTIQYIVRPQTTVAVGLCECEIKLYGAGDKLLASPGFNILVSEGAIIDEEELESADEVDFLTGLISDATEAIAGSKAATEEAEAINEQSRELIQDLTDKQVDLQKLVDAAEADANRAEGMANQAEAADRRALASANEANNSAQAAQREAVSAAEASDQAEGFADAASSMASAAVAAKEGAEAAKAAAEEAAKKLDDRVNSVVSVNGFKPDSSGNLYFDWVARKNEEAVQLELGAISSGFNYKLKYELFENMDEVAVQFDGRLYMCVPEFGYAAGDGYFVHVGNKYLMSTSETDTGEPFVIWGYKGVGFLNLTFKDGGSHEMSIYGYKITTNPLPEEYLPDCVVKSVNGVKPDSNGNVNVTGSGGSGGGFVAQDTAPEDTSLLWVDTSDGTEGEGDEPEVVIPEKLPNPSSLTFTGAVNATYDGSQPVTVEIPGGGGSGGSGGGDTDELLLDFTATEDVQEIKLPLTGISSRLNNAAQLKIYMHITLPSADSGTAMGSLSADFYRSWILLKIFEGVKKSPTNSASYASFTDILSVITFSKDYMWQGTCSGFTKNQGDWVEANRGSKFEGPFKDADALRLTSTLPMGAGTIVRLYARGNLQ